MSDRHGYALLEAQIAEVIHIAGSLDGQYVTVHARDESRHLVLDRALETAAHVDGGCRNGRLDICKASPRVAAARWPVHGDLQVRVGVLQPRERGESCRPHVARSVDLVKGLRADVDRQGAERRVDQVVKGAGVHHETVVVLIGKHIQAARVDRLVVGRHGSCRPEGLHGRLQAPRRGSTDDVGGFQVDVERDWGRGLAVDLQRVVGIELDSDRDDARRRRGGRIDGGSLVCLPADVIGNVGA